MYQHSTDRSPNQGSNGRDTEECAQPSSEFAFGRDLPNRSRCYGNEDSGTEAIEASEGYDERQVVCRQPHGETQYAGKDCHWI